MADIADYDDILVSLTAEVATTYVNLRTIEERIRLAKQNVKLQQDSLKLVELQDYKKRGYTADQEEGFDIKTMK